MSFVKSFRKTAGDVFGFGKGLKDTEKKYDKIMGKKGAHKNFDATNEKHVKAMLKAQGIKY